jgi:hypothetical protein
MKMRAWVAWGISFFIVGAASARPPERVTVDGKVPSSLTQDYFQAEQAPPCRLPESVTDSWLPRYTPPTAEASLGGALAGLEITPGFRLVSATSTSTTTISRARVAFDMAERHFHSCDAEEARRWYREVMRLAPGSLFAIVSAERLNQKPNDAPKPESAEPPLADAPAEITALQVRVLWEAARQYKEAVDSGDRIHIDNAGKTLDALLKQLRPTELNSRKP